jgi:hypothetical protein
MAIKRATWPSKYNFFNDFQEANATRLAIRLLTTMRTVEPQTLRFQQKQVGRSF